jgi:hypothetical protein
MLLLCEMISRLGIPCRGRVENQMMIDESDQGLMIHC